MKNKRLLIILIIFAFLTLIVVLSSTIFTVSKIEVVWTTVRNVLDSEDDEDIIESAQFKMGESIFFVDKEKYINNLEKENPYLLVYGIEIMFPNKLVVYAAERVPVYALKVTDSSQPAEYNLILMDKTLKVLEIAAPSVLTDSATLNVLEIQNIPLSDLDFEVGTIASQLVADNILPNFINAMESAGYSKIQLKAFVNKLILESCTRYEFTIYTNWGITIIIDDASKKFTEKIFFALSVFEYCHDAPVPITSGTINVFETENGIIEGGHNY